MIYPIELYGNSVLRERAVEIVKGEVDVKKLSDVAGDKVDETFIGSFFILEINLIVSSERPLGALKFSISVVKPYLYS